MKAGYNKLSSQERSWGARTQHLCLCHLRLSRERQCGRWLTMDFGVSRVALDLGPRIPPPSGPRFASPTLAVSVFPSPPVSFQRQTIVTNLTRAARGRISAGFVPPEGDRIPERQTAAVHFFVQPSLEGFAQSVS